MSAVEYSNMDGCRANGIGDREAAPPVAWHRRCRQQGRWPVMSQERERAARGAAQPHGTSRCFTRMCEQGLGKSVAECSSQCESIVGTSDLASCSCVNGGRRATAWHVEDEPRAWTLTPMMALGREWRSGADSRPRWQRARTEHHSFVGFCMQVKRGCPLMGLLPR